MNSELSVSEVGSLAFLFLFNWNIFIFEQDYWKDTGF